MMEQDDLFSLAGMNEQGQEPSEQDLREQARKRIDELSREIEHHTYL